MKRLVKAMSVWVLLLTMVVPLLSRAQSGAELYRPEGYRYGKFEASIQFAEGNGVISSFFLWKDRSESQNVFWNEVDIEKFGENCNQFLSNLIYGQPQTNHDEVVETEADICADFHTYTIEWTPDRITWFVDGAEVRESLPEDAAVFMENAEDGMQFRFNIWVGNADFGGVFDPAILPVHQYIDWVQYSEYTPGEGDEDTDFTLSWREDFDTPASGTWQKGSWASPFNLSFHHPSNVNFQDGMAILSLTEKGKEGLLDEFDTDSETLDTESSPDSSDSDDDSSDGNTDDGCGCATVGSERWSNGMLPALRILLSTILR